MISGDNQIQIHLQRFKNYPPHPSYIAGFIDGDGCIFIRKISDGFQSGISITQCRTNILQIMRYHFGGSITTTANRNNKKINIMDEQNYYDKHTQRNQYNLLIRSNEYSLLLKHIKNNMVIKNGQINCLNEFLQLVNLQNKSEEKEELYMKCSNYNKQKISSNIIFGNITIEYIAGLFDAEGCFYICLKKFSRSYISITQKNNPDVLVYISEFLGLGNIDCETKFKIYKKPDCLKFIQLVKEHLIVKYNQAEAFETFLTTNNETVKKDMYKICNEEKHKIETFSELNQNKSGKDGYLETLKLRNIKTQFCREILNNQFYKEKLEKMKGDGNHNYGKSFSEETKKKMSSSIRDAKGGISDEIIIQVRKLIEEGNKNIEIQELLGLPRHIVTRIKNGDLVCRNEEKIYNKKLSREEVNLSKRKIHVDEIIFVIEKIIEKWKPIHILDYLIEERNKNSIPNDITIDIVKNIKRNLKNNKKNIYESETSKENYHYYLSLLEKYKNM
jgi:hypothetical protein